MSVDWATEVGTPVTNEFGGAGVYYSVGNPGTSFDVVGVFDAGYKEVEIIDSLSYTSDSGPTVGITDIQFALLGITPQQNDKYKVMDPLYPAFYGKTFVAKEVKPDSHGITRLMLQLATVQL